MTAFRAIFVATVQQLSDRRRVLGFGVMALAPTLLLLALSRTGQFDGLDTDLGMLAVAPFLSMIVPITAVILGGAAFGDERRDKTLSFLVLRPIRRVDVVAAKTAGAAAVSSAFAVFGSLA
ncbi:MAG: ABC transporter permease, partial [Gemmatimonadetes bacterium]|nr:ABC transporter permease [Gemmatimonadota bacterium]